MSISRKLLWLGLIVTTIILGNETHKFRCAGTRDVVDFEWASRSQANEILAEWKKADLVDNAQFSLHVDYFFILFYVVLMIGHSNDQTTVERNSVLNPLLRLNVALAVVVGILDLIENSILLSNLRADCQHSSYAITLVKFSLAGWIVSLWVISQLKNLHLSNNKVTTASSPG